jgi:hypothetical protein
MSHPHRSLRVMAIACAALASLALPRAALTQALDSAGVRQAALDYLDGFYSGDSTLHIRSIRPEVYKWGFYRPDDSTAYRPGQQMQWSGFHAFTRRVRESKRPTPASAPKEVRILDLMDQTAAVKVTAWWGIDYLLMGRYDGKWMISHVLWQSMPAKRASAPEE